MNIIKKYREPTITYMYGYVSGQKNQPVINASSASVTTDKVVEHCIKNPNDNLIETFMRFM